MHYVMMIVAVVILMGLLRRHDRQL